MFSTAVAPFFCSHQQVTQVLILPVFATLVILCLLIVIVLIGVKFHLIVVLFGFLKFPLMKAVVFRYTRKQTKHLQPKG